MEVGVNERINPSLELCTVHDCASCDGVLLRNSVEWTAEDFERKLGFDEWSDERTELGLLVHVDLYVLFEKRRALEVPLGVFRFGFRYEGDVPSKFEALDDFVGVEIAFERASPDFDGE